MPPSTSEAVPPTGARTPGRPVRVLLAKVGLDGHDRGIKLVARTLADAGMEVIYTGTRATPDEVARAALQEDAEVVGLSFLSGDHMVLAPRVIEALRAHGLEDVLVVVGGIVLAHQVPALERLGVHRVFPPGTPPAHIVHYIHERVRPDSHRSD